MRIFIGSCVALVALAFDLILGLPTYGLVGSLRTGHDPLAHNGGWAQLGWVLLWGLPGLGVVALVAAGVLAYSERR